MKKSQKHKGK